MILMLSLEYWKRVQKVSERITDATQAFWHMVATGNALMQSHLDYEQAEHYPLTRVWTPGKEQSFHVQHMKLSSDKISLIVNASLTLEGIPPECFEYRLGNRSALEWVIDQYQMTEDLHADRVSDPNRKDDPEYIVRLVCQVVTVSLETVRMVNDLQASVNFNDFQLVGIEPFEKPMKEYWRGRPNHDDCNAGIAGTYGAGSPHCNRV
jgi:predicted helicase